MLAGRCIRIDFSRAPSSFKKIKGSPLRVVGLTKVVADCFDVRWFNPRTGGALSSGTVSQVSGPGVVSIGQPPSETGQDWVALVRRP